MQGTSAAPQIPADPNLASEQAQAQRSLIAGLSNEARLDTANIMARYGMRLALANAGGAGMALPPAPAPVSVVGTPKVAA